MITRAADQKKVVTNKHTVALAEIKYKKAKWLRKMKFTITASYFFTIAIRFLFIRPKTSGLMYFFLFVFIQL